MYVGVRIFLVLAGAGLYWFRSSALDLGTVGLVCMIVGIASLVALLVQVLRYRPAHALADDPMTLSMFHWQ